VPAKRSHGPWLWPLALAAVGILLLLSNFLLLGDFDLVSLWPLALVLVGAAILLRGDLLPNADARTFGITRGSVESATLEISAGEVDVQIRGLQQEGRLIAGQYAFSSRPGMRVNDTHAYLKMERAATPWLSFADWQMGIAHDLPWQLLISSYLGQVNLDLLGLIRLVCPVEALAPLDLRSTLGNVHIVTPMGYRTQIAVQGGRLFRVHVDTYRYEEVETNVFISREADEGAALVEVTVSGTFGDVYLT
jgi:LiaI-LiaF-like transmembrane region